MEVVVVVVVVDLLDGDGDGGGYGDGCGNDGVGRLFNCGGDSAFKCKINKMVAKCLL